MSRIQRAQFAKVAMATKPEPEARKETTHENNENGAHGAP
jgi:hypothetical protein